MKRHYEDVPDEELAGKAKHGDEKAFEELVVRHEADVKRWIRWVDRRPDRGDDLAQEAFVKAWRFKNDFRGDSSWKTWMMKIAFRTCLDQRRRNEPIMEEIQHDTLPDHMLLTDRSDMEQVVLNKVGLMQITAILDELPVENRQILVLRHVEGYNSSEIGEILGRPAGTVRRILRDTLDRVRKALKIKGLDDNAHWGDGK